MVPRLRVSPSLLAGGTFGRVFDVALPDLGQVYGQPIVSNGTLLVVTETGPPIANAGPDQSVFFGYPVQLDGSGSTSGDTHPVTYLWAQTAGPAVTLDDRRAVRPRFTAPSVVTQVTFTLTVTNSSGLTRSDAVTGAVAKPK